MNLIQKLKETCIFGKSMEMLLKFLKNPVVVEAPAPVEVKPTVKEMVAMNIILKKLNLQ
jgi:hypothetical protein